MLVVATAKRGWIGIDVGTRAIKLAQVERAPHGLRLVDAIVIPRTTTTSSDGPDGTAPATCREEVRAALAMSSRFSGRTAACTLSMHWCQAKTLKVPVEDGTADRTLIARKMESAGYAEHVDFDFWRTDVVEDGDARPTDGVIALAVSRRNAAQLAADVSRCGLDCRALDGVPMALTRAVGMVSAADYGRPVAAVDWGFGEATLCAISGHTPAYVRRLRGCGFGSVLQAVGGALGLHVDELETLVSTSPNGRSAADHAARQELQRAIPDLARLPLRTVVDELRRTLTFLKNQLPALAPERIWVFGAGAIWRQAGEFLGSRVDLPVATWRLCDAGIGSVPGLSPPEEILAPAVTLSALAWSSP
jgi:Tfp pilus assembly PilM family ATPase